MHRWLVLFFLVQMVFADLYNSTFQNRSLSENDTSVERSVSVSFDNTKIYFFGDKIEFAGEVHNRYPENLENGNGNDFVTNTEKDEHGHILRKWGTPVPPGLRPARPMPRVHYIDAECQNDNMKISILFNGSFSGLIYSSKYAYNPDCLYVNGTGSQRYEFYIRLNRCGTLGGGPKGRNEDEKKMMWNTLTIQYNPLIEEEYDEHFKVTCEYGYQFWKTVSFPVIDVTVPTESPLLFSLSPPECQMEIREGFNLNGPRISGPVNVGDPLTLVIYMRSPTVGFDIIINNCVAHNGANKRMALIDDSGCPVENKIISDFKGVDIHHGVYESKVFAYFKAFRFTGSPALYIECDVRMCHGICPKQRCYWRNLRESNTYDGAAIHGRNKNNTFSNQTAHFDSVENVTKPGYLNSSTHSPNVTTSRITKYYYSSMRPTTISTSATKTSSWTSTSSTTTPSPFSPIRATITRRQFTSSTTSSSAKFKPISSSTQTSSTTTTPTTTVKPSPFISRVSPATKVPKNQVIPESKVGQTSTVNLNLNHRRLKRHERQQQINSTISETLNLFQALEVRSEPVSDPEDFSGFKGSEGSIVCIKTVGFTAIICIMVLIVVLMTSIILMFGTRLRRLKELHRDITDDDRYTSNKDAFTTLSVHRTC